MRSTRWILSTAAAGALTLALAAPAAAHVTVAPDEATKGGYAAFTFRVPNERPDAGTVKIEVTMPAEHPITSVRTRPMPGWSVSTTKEGDTVRTITWTADPGLRVGPGEYQEFDVSAGPLPEDTDRLLLPTTQTYDSGEVVAWDAPATEGQPEPEHPAPVLELVAEEAGEATAVQPAAGSASAAEDGTARWLGGAGLAVGALGLGAGAGAVLRTRRGGST